MKATLVVFAYVLRSSGNSRKSAALIVRYCQKKKWISVVLSILQLHINLGTTELIVVEFSAKCTSPNEHFYQKTGNVTCSSSDWISKDRITYCKCVYALCDQLIAKDVDIHNELLPHNVTRKCTWNDIYVSTFHQDTHQASEISTCIFPPVQMNEAFLLTPVQELVIHKALLLTTWSEGEKGNCCWRG